jgi:hypothetical protein
MIGAADSEAKVKVEAVKDLEGLSDELKEKLEAANLTMVGQLKGLSTGDLTSIEGLTEDDAQEIAEAVNKVA